jgi:hypothetical protein
MSTNAVDFVAAVAGQPVKNGTVVTNQPLGAYGNATALSTDGNTYVSNSPTISDIQSKYIEHFDDPNYYSN